MHLKPSKHHAYYCNMGLNGLCVYSLSEGGALGSKLVHIAQNGKLSGGVVQQ